MAHKIASGSKGAESELDPAAVKLAVDGMLAEYSALRNEISQRSTAQLAIVTFHITAVGALTSVALTDVHHAFVLLLMPYSSWALGRLFIDHARAIHGIASYTEKKLWKHIRKLSDPDIPSWEQHLHEQERDKKAGAPLSLAPNAAVFQVARFLHVSDKRTDWFVVHARRYSYAFSLFSIFMAPPIAVLVAALSFKVPPLASPLAWIAWAGGIVVVVSLIPSWVWFFDHPMQPGEGDIELGQSS